MSEALIHPCAVSVAYDAPTGRMIITYRHKLVDGQCAVCREPIVYLKFEKDETVVTNS